MVVTLLNAVVVIEGSMIMIGWYYYTLSLIPSAPMIVLAVVCYETNFVAQSFMGKLQQT